MIMDQEKSSKKVRLGQEEYQILLAKAKELEALKKELEGLKQQYDEMRDKFLRSAADFDNARKRMAKEREEFVRFANARLIREFLPLIDNFDRALTHSGDKKRETDPSLQDGIVLIRRQLVDFLVSHGVIRLDVQGKKFDPHFHEAVDHIETVEHPEDTVLEEVEAGYLLEGRLIRPAKVRVAKARPGQGGAPALDADKSSNGHQSLPPTQ